MQSYPKQSKSKIFPHAPYDMYSEYQPIFGYYIDDDNTSDTFGQVLFGQIGEKNIQAEVDSYRDDCDLSIIKEQLLRSSSANDWSAVFEDDEEEDEESAVDKASATSVTPEFGDEDTSKSGIVNNEDKEEA